MSYQICNIKGSNGQQEVFFSFGMDNSIGYSSMSTAIRMTPSEAREIADKLKAAALFADGVKA